MQVPVPYRDSVSRKYPEQVAIAIAKDPQGKHNPITLGWMMCTSGKPPMLAISVAPPRYSYQAIRHSRQFVLAFPSVAMAAETLHFGTVSGRDEDKLATQGTRTQPATEIDSVLLMDAVANFECVLEHEFTSGDHAIFVGRVVASSMHQDPTVQRLYNLGEKNLQGLPVPTPGC